jgi:hypothetical protein
MKESYEHTHCKSMFSGAKCEGVKIGEKWHFLTTDQKVGGLNPFGITKNILRKQDFLFEGAAEACFRRLTKNKK